MTNDAKRTSQLGIVTTLSANDRVVVLTNPASAAQTQTIPVSNFVNSAMQFIPVANGTSLGLISGGPGISIAANGQLTAPLPLATNTSVGVVQPAANGGVTIGANGTISILNANGTLVFPSGGAIGANVEGDSHGYDFYGPSSLDYISMTYGPTPSSGAASYLSLSKLTSDINASPHYYQMQIWQGNTSWATWYFYGSNNSLVYPDGTSTTGNTIIVPGNYDIQSTGNTLIQTSAAASAKTWKFDTTGTITFPDGSTQNTAATVLPNTHYVYSANYVATANDNFIVVNNNGADRTIYLPNSGIKEGKTYTIKKGISFTSTNTIVSANGLLIDGSANVNINSGYGYVTVTYSNTSGTPVWWITSKLL